MPKNYWMVVQTPEDFEVSRNLGFTIHGLDRRHRRRAQRMEPDDRVLFYVKVLRKWVAAASITSRYFEDHSPIWKSTNGREPFPYRVKMSPYVVLREEDYIDAFVLGPGLEYVKRWPPERWPLAFIDPLHLLPQRDFRLIENEMKKAMRGRRRPRRRRGQGRYYERPVEPEAVLEEEAPSADSSGADAEQEPPEPREPAASATLSNGPPPGPASPVDETAAQSEPDVEPAAPAEDPAAASD